MFEFDSDGGWDVSQEADSLTKSLFGGTTKKKEKKKARKDVSGISSSIVLDSDDETFTKKGMRKLKEKRRRKKKQDKKGEEDAGAESPSATEHTTENQSSTSKQSNHSGTEISSDPTDLKVKKSNKRKKEISVEDVEDSPTVPKKKRKQAKESDLENDASTAPGSVSTEETPKKKRKRNRKKKNNSKKNKYAHLALNRKEKEAGESAKDNSDDLPGKKKENTHISTTSPHSSEKLAKKNKIDTGTKKEEEKIANISNGHSEADETGSVKANSRDKVKPSKLETGANLHVDLNKVGKKKNKKLGLTHDNVELADSENISLKMKKNKRKEDTLSTPAKKKKRDKEDNKTKYDVENTEVEGVGDKTNDVKDSKKVDSKKMLELQRRQKILLQALVRSGSSNEDIESSDLKQKKKSKKENKSKSLEAPATKIQSQNTKSSPANLKKPAEKSSVTGQTNKTSVDFHSKEKADAGDSSFKKRSIWGEKATALGSQAQEKLNAARFRYLNEQLYTCQGREALQLFRADGDAFKVYHTGFENQASKWPVNPVNVLIKQIKDKSPSLVIADFGCGDAKLAQALPQKVHSFDLVALNPWVKACDMSSVPLQNESVDIAVFCLSLMGTNLDDYICEANRVLKIDGLLKIVEVSSRFKGLSTFLASVCSHGFQLLNKRDLSQMFYLMDFKKLKLVKKGASNKSVSLKPCLYKKR